MGFVITDTYSFEDLTEFEDKVEEETVTEIDVTEDLVEDDEIIEIFSTLQQKIGMFEMAIFIK